MPTEENSQQANHPVIYTEEDVNLVPRPSRPGSLWILRLVRSKTKQSYFEAQSHGVRCYPDGEQSPDVRSRDSLISRQGFTCIARSGVRSLTGDRVSRHGSMPWRRSLHSVVTHSTYSLAQEVMFAFLTLFSAHSSSNMSRTSRAVQS